MDQLAIGGKMIIPVGTPLLQELLLLEKDEEIHTTVLTEVRFAKFSSLSLLTSTCTKQTWVVNISKVPSERSN